MTWKEEEEKNEIWKKEKKEEREGLPSKDPPLFAGRRESWSPSEYQGLLMEILPLPLPSPR